MSVTPMRRTLWLAVAGGIWLALQFALVMWWATVIERQANSIAALQALSGAGRDLIYAQAERTHVMLVGESSTFLALLVVVSLLLAWLYWREHRRARAMQAFFASVTHELRTPLTSIRLQAEAIAEGERREELARRLLEDSSRLESQIDKALELARIEGGGPLSEQSIPLHAWIARSLEGVGIHYGDRLDLRAHVDASVPPIAADANALQMILRNLVENSVRHSGATPVSVRLTATQRGDHVVLEYHDNGSGIAADAPQLGQLFARGRHSSGTGVGLYLVKRLMQRMGGRARFNTAPGEGYRSELWFRVST